MPLLLFRFNGIIAWEKLLEITKNETFTFGWRIYEQRFQNLLV